MEMRVSPAPNLASISSFLGKKVPTRIVEKWHESENIL